MIAPKELQARLDLAVALEKTGDWPGALQNYHQAALDQPPFQSNVAQRFFDADGKYTSANNVLKSTSRISARQAEQLTQTLLQPVCISRKPPLVSIPSFTMP